MHSQKFPGVGFESIKQALEESVEIKLKTIKRHELLIWAVSKEMVSALRQGKKIIWMGNGGSAADAQHLAGELVGRFRHDRPPLASLALNCNTSVITAIGNDFSFDSIFSRQLLALARESDIVIGLSTSGNSKNILSALEDARLLKCKTVGLTGLGGGTMAGLVDYLIDVDSTFTPRIQEVHITIGHILCQLIEDELYG